MDPLYVAADFFIGFLTKTPAFRIDLRCLDLLTKRASSEVASTLSNGGPLSVFKKFRDVFALGDSSVTLTDAFLSLYAFPSSAAFKAHKESGSVFETDAAQFFKLLLIRRGKAGFSELFATLLSREDFCLAKFFSHYSRKDMLAFFLKHSDTFDVSGETVSLVQGKDVNFFAFRKIMNIESLARHSDFVALSQMTYFLLSCFKTLHYLVLKQCTSFVLGSVRSFLNSFPLIQQRCLFDCLPLATMDSSGYLSLKAGACFHPALASRSVQLMSLVVCILAFEMQAPIRRVVKMVSRRAPTSVGSMLCNATQAEQFRFFRGLPTHFVASGNSEVSLHPSFVFPRFPFENDDVDPLIYNRMFRPAKLPYFSEADLFSSDSSKTNLGLKRRRNVESDNGRTKKRAEEDCDSNKLNRCDTSTSQNLLKQEISHLEDCPSDQLQAIQCITNRLKYATAYLRACFEHSRPKQFLASCLFVMNDVWKSFDDCSQAAKLRFLQEYRSCFEKASQAEEVTVPSNSCISSQEKVLLFVTYALAKEKEIHFETLSSCIECFSKVNIHFASTSSRHFFFSKLSYYVNVSPEGCVKLNKTFKAITSQISPLFKSPAESKATCCKADASTNDENSKEANAPALSLKNVLNDSPLKKLFFGSRQPGCSTSKDPSPADNNAPKKSNSLFSKRSRTASSRNSGTSVELKAVNFVSFLLWKYGRSGVSIRFLVTHLHLAAPEVRTLVMKWYQGNLRSFLLNHKRVFRVVPETDRVYLIRANSKDTYQ